MRKAPIVYCHGVQTYLIKGRGKWTCFHCGCVWPLKVAE